MNSGSWFAKDFVREYDLDTDRKVAGVFIRVFDLNGSCLSVNVSFSVRVKRIFLREVRGGEEKKIPTRTVGFLWNAVNTFEWDSKEENFFILGVIIKKCMERSLSR